MQAVDDLIFPNPILKTRGDSIITDAFHVEPHLKHNDIFTILIDDNFLFPI